MTTKEKLLTFIAGAELALCFLLVVIIGLEVRKPLEITVAESEADAEIVDALKDFCTSQADYYEYQLNWYIEHDN